MKKIIYYVCAAGAMLLAASCAKESISIDDPSLKAGMVEMTFNITNEAVKSDLTSDLKINFENGDSVAVFAVLDSTISPVCRFNVENASGTYAEIRGEVPEGAKSFVAVYPYTAASSYIEDTLVVNVPYTQYIPAGKNFAPTALVCYARAEKGQTLALKNAVALLKFTVSSSDVKSVGISANCNEPISGSNLVSFAASAATASGYGFVRVAPEGDSTCFAPGTYFATVLPAQIKSGIAVVAAKAAGCDYKLSTKASTIARNSCLNLGSIEGTSFLKEITTKDQLLAFARCARFLPAGYEVKLGADIDLSGVVWPNPTFCGVLDGQNHRVYNFTAANTASLENVGFIGQLGDGINPGTLKNICLGSRDYDFATKTGTWDGVSTINFTSNTLTTTYKYPGPVAYAHVGATVENVVNFANVTVAANADCKRRLGGICGTVKASVTVKDCINFGTITDNSPSTKEKSALAIGGISGWIDGVGTKLINCVNKGDIVSNGDYTTLLGGIAGGASSSSEVTDCINYGSITHNGDIIGTTYTGGLVGHMKTNAKFNNCHNYGAIKFNFNAGSEVKANVEIGGLSGYCNAAASYTDCTNSGDMTVGTCTSSALFEFGGLLGRNVTGAATFTNCKNTGKLSSALSTTDSANGICIGGLVGRTHQATKLIGCSSNADITNEGNSGYTKVGGVFGYNQAAANINNCSYTGKITADETAGGTKSAYSGCVGWNNAKIITATNVNIDATVDIRSSSSLTYSGGLYGYLICSTTGTTYAGCVVKYAVTGADATNGGVLVGCFDGTYTKTCTIGSTAAPVKVSGSFNGTALTAENYAGYLKGSASTSDKLVINAEYNAE